MLRSLRILPVIGIVLASCCAHLAMAQPLPGNQHYKTIMAEPASNAKGRITVIPAAGAKMTVFQASKVRPIVVHMTSLDEECARCVKSNLAMLKAQNALGDDFEFVQLVYEAWDPNLNLAHFPSAIVHYQGSSIIDLGTNLGDNLVADISGRYAVLKAVMDRPLSDTPLPTVTGLELEGYVAEKSKDKFLLLHVSSLDAANCPSCVMSNKLVRGAVRDNGADYAYAEMLYEPYSAVGNDKALASFLRKHGASITGLPAIFMFSKGKMAGNRTGLWDTVSADLQAFQKKQKR